MSKTTVMERDIGSLRLQTYIRWKRCQWQWFLQVIIQVEPEGDM